MALTARRLWSRLTSMSWVELQTRVRQEVSKRIDVTEYKFGFRRGQNALQAPSRPPGKFFFFEDEAPKLARLLEQHLPDEAERIVAEANEISCHRFQLLGYQALDYGAEIDWHLDAVHGVRSPLIPWFKINFLNFAEVGDHKVTWELNRHQHMVTLAKAWLLTKNESYVREILAQWYSWQRSNPYPLGANWASSLEIAFRSLSWIWVLHLLGQCLVLPASFQQDVQGALALNGRQIERYLSTYFSPNTHLIGEAVALFFIGTLYPQISSAENWRNCGWRIVQEEAFRQVRADGTYFEQSLYYHVYALDFFLHARLLASRNGMLISSEFDGMLKKMLGVIRALAQNGAPDGFGDDDGGRVFNPRRNRAEHLTDPLVIGCALFPNEISLAGSTLTEEAIWLFGERQHFAPQPPRDQPKPRSQCFPEGGFYIAANSEPFPQQVVIDAGPQGTGHGGHGHADALNIKLAFCNRPWLVDSGTFCYIGLSNDRDSFRGTRAHNTLAVDSVDQAEPEGPFSWRSLPHTQADLWITGGTFTLFAGSHSGFERLQEPVRHRRFLFHLHGGFSLVRDVAEGSGSHQLETSWHFASDLEVFPRENGFRAVAPRRSDSLDEPDHLILLPVADPRWNSEVLQECVSPAYGLKLSAPVVRCNARIGLPAEHAVLLIPDCAVSDKTDEFIRDDRQLGDPGMSATVYRYRRADTSHVMIFRQDQHSSWSFGPWTSDARFFYICVEDQRLAHIVFCQGSFALLRGESVISHHETLQWLEWSNRQGLQRLTCSDEAASRSFLGTRLDSEIVT